MIIAIDVHYRENSARAASIEFQDWDADEAEKVHIVDIDEVAEYVPGAFYRRELPCIMEVLKQSDLEKVKVIVIDGYVILNNEGKHGLGAYLFHALDKKIPIVGVAKNRFHNNELYTQEVLRGESQKPLYVTSLGMEPNAAAKCLSKMKGPYRIPDLLKLVDRIGRE